MSGQNSSFITTEKLTELWDRDCPLADDPIYLDECRQIREMEFSDRELFHELRSCALEVRTDLTMATLMKDGVTTASEESIAAMVANATRLIALLDTLYAIEKLNT